VDLPADQLGGDRRKGTGFLTHHVLVVVEDLLGRRRWVDVGRVNTGEASLTDHRAGKGQPLLVGKQQIGLDPGRGSIEHGRIDR